VEPTRDLWGRLCARLASGQEGIEILMHPEVGQNIATAYPVYSMLNSLDANKGTPHSSYPSPDETIPQKDIQGGLEKLQKEPNQKAQLNTLLRNTWERYKKTEEYKKKSEIERKKVTLDTMLAAIELEDGWLNEIIDPLSSKPEKDAAMRVIGQNPKEW